MPSRAPVPSFAEAARFPSDAVAPLPPHALATRALAASATAWFATAALGQLAFLAYILGFYGRAALRGAPEDWNRVLSHGWIAGDPVGNLVVAVHLLFAAVVVSGGLLQLVPQVRRHAPALHRWNGRVYVVSAMVAALAGMAMILTRGAAGSLAQDLAINVNAVLVLCFATLAWRDARARRFDAHRRWALRLFVAVSGVWYFRLMLPLWIVVNQGPVGFDPGTFRGPAIVAISILDYALPLAVLELYLRAQRGGPRVRLAMAGGLGVATLLTAAGIVAAAMLLWLPML